jgi:hypothetical protein
MIAGAIVPWTIYQSERQGSLRRVTRVLGKRSGPKRGEVTKELS